MTWLTVSSTYNDDVHCRLIPCKIGNLPTYEAISYTWADESGDTRKTQTIYVNSLPFYVTVNCKAALKRVRLPRRARTIWIDDVCIDQNNDEERGHQARLMPQIYSRARRYLPPKINSHTGWLWLSIGSRSSL